MPLFVAGLSHRNAPVELREQLAVDEDKLRELLRDIAGMGIIREALILSTCNRVEVYAVADVPGEARTATFRRLCHHRGVGPDSVETALYTYRSEEHTSELQSRLHLVCRLLLEKKKTTHIEECD